MAVSGLRIEVSAECFGELQQGGGRDLQSGSQCHRRIIASMRAADSGGVGAVLKGCFAEKELARIKSRLVVNINVRMIVKRSRYSDTDSS